MPEQHRPWVLVTGGTRGIGRGIVQGLARAGYDVAFTYRSSDRAADELSGGLVGAPQWCEGYRCDMARPDEVAFLAESLLAKHGAPYAIINNAGVTRDTLFMNMDHGQWGGLMSTNLDSAYLVIRAFARSMLAAGDGCIVNMSSVTAFKGNVGQVNYAASKAALIGMTRSLALEFGRFNIRVNAIAPGLIATEMTEQMDDAQRKKMIAQVPLRRMGTVDDVAAVVAFLIGPGGAYFTGQTLVIDGGLTA